MSARSTPTAGSQTLGSLLSSKGRTVAVEITDPVRAVNLTWGLRRHSLPLGWAGPAKGRGTLLRIPTGSDCMEDVWIRFALRQPTQEASGEQPKHIRLTKDVEADIIDCLLLDPGLQDSMSKVLKREMTKSILGKTKWTMSTAPEVTFGAGQEESPESPEEVEVAIAYGDCFTDDTT